MADQPHPNPPRDPLAPDAGLDDAVAAVRGGEREAYRQVVTTCEARVRLVIAAILPDSDGVDGLAQEVFVTAYGKLDAFITSGRFNPCSQNTAFWPGTSHGNGANMLFADGHVEQGRQTNWISLATRHRWNNDGQPHPETWARE